MKVEPVYRFKKKSCLQLLLGKTKNICSCLIKPLHSAFLLLRDIQYSNTECWGEEENGAKTGGGGRSVKIREVGLLVVHLYYHKSKKNSAWYKIVSKKRCFAAMESEGASRWTRPCLYAFSSVASSAASVTWR